MKDIVDIKAKVEVVQEAKVAQEDKVQQKVCTIRNRKGLKLWSMDKNFVVYEIEVEEKKPNDTIRLDGWEAPSVFRPKETKKMKLKKGDASPIWALNRKSAIKKFQKIIDKYYEL